MRNSMLNVYKSGQTLKVSLYISPAGPVGEGWGGVGHYRVCVFH